jgi:hypothetical protein
MLGQNLIVGFKVITAVITKLGAKNDARNVPE